MTAPIVPYGCKGGWGVLADKLKFIETAAFAQIYIKNIRFLNNKSKKRPIKIAKFPFNMSFSLIWIKLIQ